MRFLFAAVAAALILPSVGCQSIGSLGNKRPSAVPAHVAQSQSAPRPLIQRTAHVQTEGALAHAPETGLFQRAGYHCPCGSGYAAADCCGAGVACGCGDACGSGVCASGGRPLGGRCGCGRGGPCSCAGNALVNGAVGCLLDCRRSDAAYNFNPGPPVAQTAYPYYTVRGPRDFLMSNPPSIGPGGYSPNCPY